MSFQFTAQSTATLVGTMVASSFIGACYTITHLGVSQIVLGRAGSGQQIGDRGFKPAIAPGEQARCWKYQYDLGKKAGPFLAIASGASWLYAARLASDRSPRARNLYILAACSVVSIIPFTFRFLMPINHELEKRAAVVETGNDWEDPKPTSTYDKSLENASTSSLIQTWGRANAMRAPFFFIGIGCALFAWTL